MKVVATVYARSNNSEGVTAYTDRIKAGSEIALVLEDSMGVLFLSNPERTKVYGKGESFTRALNVRTRATLAARRHFGRGIVVA